MDPEFRFEKISSRLEFSLNLLCGHGLGRGLGGHRTNGSSNSGEVVPTFRVSLLIWLLLSGFAVSIPPAWGSFWVKPVCLTIDLHPPSLSPPKIVP